MISRRSRATQALTIGVAGIAALALSAGNAHANFSGKAIRVQPSGKVAGSASFVASGDRLTVCDTVADGYSVSVTVYDESAGGKKIYTVKAAGKGKCTPGTKNLTEGHTYSFWSDTSGSSGGMGRIATDKA
jgi:hypothetical protein